MFEDSFWWPLDLSEREAAAIRELRDDLLANPPLLDRGAARRAGDELTAVMRDHVDEIVERDGLPHLCHIINGWGDAPFRGYRLSDEIVPFVHRDAAGDPFLLQRDPEGDFHPWQTFAYTVMAGADADRQLAGTEYSLRDLACNSRYLDIDVDEGHELGHLLFALADLDPDPAGRPFSLRGKSYDLAGLMDLAVEAHHWGSFDVCRKFHLTEGLCAVAAKVDGMSEYRQPAQGFLHGQLDMLLVLGAILRQAAIWRGRGETPTEDSLLRQLRDSLVMGNYIENHFYYAGHLIEVAVFADRCGFELAAEHRAAMALVANELNAYLVEYLPHLYFPECFLHLGHYRRSISLLADMEDARAANQPIDKVDLTAYVVDFTTRPRGEAFAAADVGPPPGTYGVFDVAPSTADPHPAFDAVVESYAELCAFGFEPKGKFSHFRRICPPGWPRSFHYELLEYEAEGVGVEIHLESDEVKPMGAVVAGLEPRVVEAFADRPVEWDAEWWSGRGRLRILFEGNSPLEAAQGLKTLIELTFETLDQAASQLRITTGC